MANTYYNPEEHLAQINRAMAHSMTVYEKAFDEQLKEERKKKHEALKEDKKTEQEIRQELFEWETAQRKAQNEFLLKLEEENKKKSLKILEKYEDQRLLQAQELNRILAAQTNLDILNAKIARSKAFDKEFNERKANAELLAIIEKQLTEEIATETDSIRKKQLENELKDIKAKYNAEDKWINDNKAAHEKTPASIIDNTRNLAKNAKASKDSDVMKDAAAKLREAANTQTSDAKEASKLNAEARAMENEARIQEARERNKARKEELKYRLTTLDGIKETLANGVGSMVKGLEKMFDSLEQPLSTFYENQARYEARLQGSENEYAKILNTISKQIGMSPFVKQSKMVEKLQTLIDTGTNYNVELRAYIATVSEGIASTFDAFDSELLRLIRIQQSDSTAARLGMEAALTKVLNNMYSDTSYLNGISDNVAHALIDASAQLNHQAAAEMEFVAQKWLGSLYSLGVSGDAVQNIAQGLGYLGSGNIEQLSGNEALMSLLAMSASKGGTSISEILTGGLTAQKTNELLYGMIQYLSEIANNTDSNNVTRASIAQVFGLTNTDLRSISNLNATDINHIYNTSLNYAQSLSEAANQVKQISSRTHISAMLNNVIDNAVTGSALAIGSNIGTYGMYKVLNIVSELVGDRGLEIPGIQAMGSGTASGIDILSIMKAAIAGGGLLASLIGSLGSISSGGLPAFSAWKGYEKSLSRGSGLQLGEGVQSGFSENTSYNSRGSGSTDDMTSSAMESSTSSAKENQSEEDKQAADDANTFYKEGRVYLKNLSDTISGLGAENTANAMRVAFDPNSILKVAPYSSDITNDWGILLQAIIAAAIPASQGEDANSDAENDNYTKLIEALKEMFSTQKILIDQDEADPLIVKLSQQT